MEMESTIKTLPFRQRRRRRIGSFKSVLSVTSVFALAMCWNVEAFLSSRHNIESRIKWMRCHSTAIPRKGSTPHVDKQKPISSKTQIEFVDFWGSKVRHGDDHDDDDGVQKIPPLPVDRNLDRSDGELPPGSYMIPENTEYEAKRACRIILALDWKQKKKLVNGKFYRQQSMERNQVIRQIQDCIAAGFQTFQLVVDGNKDDDVEMIRHVLKETPNFVEMHWIVRLDIPRQISVSTIRETVFDMLSTIQSDSLDTILIPYRSDFHQSEYLLEILDVLHDMQRDGYIRSIGVENWPAELIAKAMACGLTIDVCQRNANLLLPGLQHDTTSPFEISEWWTNPLAGHVLSSIFVARSEPPTHSDGWKDVLAWFDIKKNSEKSWAPKYKSGGISNAKLWKLFQEEVYEILEGLSWKYEVSISTIVLRWTLQEKMEAAEQKSMSPSSVVYPLYLMEEPENHLETQIRGLRDVFRFELQDEDMETLNRITARPKPKVTSLRIDEVDVPMADIPLEFLREFEAINAAAGMQDDEGMTTNSDEYLRIHFNNPALWL